MSTLNIIYNKEKFANLDKNENLIDSLISTSANTLNKKASEIIIHFQPFSSQEAVNLPDILIRGETSLARRILIKSWADSLLKILTDNIDSSKSRCAVKTYVIDSEWTESNVYS